MNQLVKIVDRLLALLTISISSVLVICVIWQVLSRYVLGAPSTVTDEMARFLFIWVGLIGAAYTTGQKRHLAIDLLTMKLHGTRKLISEVIIQLAIILFAAVVMVYGGAGLVIKLLNAGQVSPALGIQMGLVYIAVPVSGVVIVFYSMVFLIEKLSSIFAHAKAPEKQEQKKNTKRKPIAIS